MNGTAEDMLKYGGESVIKWMHRICQLTWKEERVTGNWMEAVIIPIHKGKGDIKRVKASFCWQCLKT